MQKTTNSPITIVPPICAAKGQRHPQWVALTLPVELAHCGGDIEDMIEADRTQYNFWSVVNHVSDDINQMANFGETQHWPPEALTTAAACFLMADAALKQWRAGKFEECLVTAHAAQQAEARLEEMLKEPPLEPVEPVEPLQASWPQKPAPEPPELISDARMAVTLRGKPVNQPIVKKFGSPFYETTLMVETAEMTIEVGKTSHDKEKLEEEIRAIMEAGEVQGSGTMANTAGHNGLNLLVLVDKWFPISEEGNASA